ncbi:MAG: DEAD/DEAH box helicase [Myxococcales bacterium]|nr:DEAD/DEAH box helicase [Myxococcales bacterium]MBK7196222.1 DEAD/DEAH box helicase [Myxococcales bacterium]
MIPASAQRTVERCFGAAALADGLAAVAAGRVHLVKPPPWPVVARVAGEVVTVRYRPEGELLRGECSCAGGGDCGHAAATALVALADQRAGAEAAIAVERQARVGEWLAELGRHQPDAPTPATNQLVAYVLDARDRDVGLTIVPAARLRGGGLSAGLPLAALADPQRGAPRWVDVDDLRRIALLRAIARATPQVTRLRLDRVPADVLEELAATGRLFWRGVDGPALAWGAPAREALAWQPCAEPADSFQLGVAAPRVIVPVARALYVDPDDARIGPLELGVLPELVARLLASPPVPAAMRATVARSLRPLWPDAPAPDAPDAPTPTEPLVPRLTVGLEPGLRNVLALVAEAGYGEARYPLAAWDPDRPATRDLLAEGRARARLDALVATTLPHGVVAPSSVALLASARAVAHVLIPTLRAEGWRCALDDSFPLEAPAAEATWVEALRPMGDRPLWFELELGVCVDGRTVPLVPILLAAIRSGQLVVTPGAPINGGAGLNLRLPEGELVYLPPDRLARWFAPLLELALRGIDADARLLLPAPVAATLDDRPDGVTAAARAQLEALLALAPAAPAAGFVGALRPYQALGLAWLRALHDAGLGGLLADDMGLGKTVQVLAFLDGLALTPRAPALVVAPRSVVDNWLDEAARFAPRLRVARHLGADRPDDAAALAPATVVITSYQTLARDLPLLRTIAWTTVVFDEAQALKNPDTQLRAAAVALAVRSRFAVTGTPIENHLGELWAQVDLVVPGLLGRRAGFDAAVRKPIEKFAVPEVLADLRARVRPFLLRRTKPEVALELPPRTEIVERVDLDVGQRDLYESLRISTDAEVRRALERADAPATSMAILDALLKLRQCCCDPRLLPLPPARTATGSAKLDHLLARLAELVDAGRTTLVFSQFTSMLALIERACRDAGLATLTFTGATRDRAGVVRKFQAGAAPILLVSLKAGGVGLNLTRADTVIHYDPWWNPAAEAQAADRAHRIGQDRPVHVYKLVARGTVEDAICKLQDDKRRLTAAALEDGGVTHLAAADLQAIYRRLTDS